MQALISTLNNISRRQVPFASLLALNRTAFDIQGAEKRELKDSFPTVTPYILGSVRVTKATKEKPASEVGIEDYSTGVDPRKVLRAEILGGQRRLKAFEVALRSVGVLPDDAYTVPGEGAELDIYGNLKSGQIVQILQYFRTIKDELHVKGRGFRTNISDAGKARLRKGTKSRPGIYYFAGRPGNNSRSPEGIWKVFTATRKVVPILIFVRHALYEPAYDFADTAERTAREKFEDHFQTALAQALSTARRF